MAKIDVLYVCRFQVERWTNELLERYSDSMPAAREELEKRRQVKEKSNE